LRGVQKAKPNAPIHPKQQQGFRMTSIQQRAALQSQIWKIANDVRGAVGGMADRGVQRLEGNQKP
jgi:hypothetical protein